MVPKFNGFDLPGFEITNTRFPRWCIVWDDKGWTTPVRRVIMGFYGKALDSDGNSWDHCSDLPYECRSREFDEWNDVPLELVSDPIYKEYLINTRLTRNWPRSNW